MGARARADDRRVGDLSAPPTSTTSASAGTITSLHLPIGHVSDEHVAPFSRSPSVDPSVFNPGGSLDSARHSPSSRSRVPYVCASACAPLPTASPHAPWCRPAGLHRQLDVALVPLPTKGSTSGRRRPAVRGQISSDVGTRHHWSCSSPRRRARHRGSGRRAQTLRIAMTNDVLWSDRGLRHGLPESWRQLSRPRADVAGSAAAPVPSARSRPALRCVTHPAGRR